MSVITELVTAPTRKQSVPLFFVGLECDASLVNNRSKMDLTNRSNRATIVHSEVTIVLFQIFH